METGAIGVHLGDVLVEGDDILGTASTSRAARRDRRARGICISEDAFRQVRGKVDAEFADIGEQSLKNIARPVRVYRLVPQQSAEPLPAGAAIARQAVDRGAARSRI